MPYTQSVSVSVYIGTGSRYERKEEAGISHFVEHLCFKGTKRRPTAKEVAEAIDSVGGLLNGSTDRELTVFYAKVARHHFDLALDVLLELVREPLFDPAEVEKERKVVLEELAMVADSPPQLADQLLDATLWPDQPLGWDVAGTEESVSALSREETLEYLQRQYTPNNMVIAVAGNIDHQTVVDAVWRALGQWQPGKPSSWFPAIENTNQGRPRCSLLYKNTEQAHINLAVRGLPWSHPDRYPLSFLSIILGESMSSRLFMELREKRGLAYDVHSYISHFLDTGTFAIYCGVDPKNAYDALQLTLDQLAQVRHDSIGEDELQRAKELAKGRLLLRLEDSRAVSAWVGSQELLLGEVRSVEEVLTEMEAVTAADLVRVAGRLFVPDQLHLAVVGPYRSDKRFAAALRL